MNCKVCGNDNPDRFSFCVNCGAQLAKFCPKCFNKAMPDYKFCGICGTKLSEVLEVPEDTSKLSQEFEARKFEELVCVEDSSGETEGMHTILEEDLTLNEQIRLKEEEKGLEQESGISSDFLMKKPDTKEKEVIDNLEENEKKEENIEEEVLHESLKQVNSDKTQEHEEFKIFVLDTGNKRFQIFDSRYQFLQSVEHNFVNPKKISVSKSGVWVSDFASYKIYKFTHEGKFMFSFGSFGKSKGELNAPMGVIEYESSLIIVDSWNNRLQIFDLKGEFIKEISLESSYIKLNNPVDLSFFEKDLFITDSGNHRVVVYNMITGDIDTFGEFGEEEGKFDSPSGIKVYENEIYVVDSGNNRIQVFSLVGDFKRSFGKWGQGSGELDTPSGIDVFDNRVFIADSWNNRVVVFSTQGDLIGNIGAFGVNPGLFKNPSDVTIFVKEVD